MAANPIVFYHDWEGLEFSPIDVDADVQKPPLYICSICLDTVYKPVIPLCMHVFCFDCLLEWLRQGNPVCPCCRAPVREPPIRDNGLETDLAHAIEIGAIEKSIDQPGKNVAARDNEYSWDGIIFAAEEQE
ncbi:hypothetical protein B0H16DRAFT_1728700 [Mycena metata]|uniref:RING-type domain-containing protein n=1 Tax=Mycena metata TaxID=1033252 RepID=A0AAD7N143_9AGAR|nr:hypothetical protein B0H16DRAFT_1728700 [Mycena metata]